MDSSSGHWYLMGSSTNKHGVTHFTMTCSNEDEADIDELVGVLVDRFGAVDDGELLGPYSIHRYVKVGGLRLGIILDEPEWLTLFAPDASQRDALTSFVPRLLEAMNSLPPGSAAKPGPAPDCRL